MTLIVNVVFSQKIEHIDPEQEKIRDLVFPHAVMAHRGTTYWAPEETESAYRWARNIGADYLEVDIQRTSDGVMIALHDDDLKRTTDVEELFLRENSSNYSAGEYSYEDLMKLDAGSWFNKVNAGRARKSFSKSAEVIEVDSKAYTFGKLLANGDIQGREKYEYTDDSGLSVDKVYIGGKQYISTLEDVLMISKGWMIARNSKGERLYKKVKVNREIESGEALVRYQFFYVKDPNDNGNRPGVYIETKEPKHYDNIETQLYESLTRYGWNVLLEPEDDNSFFINSLVNTGNTNGKIVLQTFSPKSLEKLRQTFLGKIPCTFLLWKGDPNMPDDTDSSYIANINFAVRNKANFIGPSIAGPPNNFDELLSKHQARMIRKSGMKVHAYSFDTEEQYHIYFSKAYRRRWRKTRTDAIFTNRAELTINTFIDLGVYPFERNKVDALMVLEQLNYRK